MSSNRIVGVGLAALVVVACGSSEPVEPQTIAVPVGVTAEDELGEPEIVEVPVVEAEAAPEASAQGAGPSLAGAQKYKAWAAVHAFVGGPIVAGRAISPTEAIAFTRDNLVGVTRDSGATFQLIRHSNGVVTAVAGAPGGPYVVAGKAGYMAMSADGSAWIDVPRYTEDEFVSVAVGPASIAGVTRGGLAVRFNKDGSGGAVAALPDKFKAKEVIAQPGGFLALAGKVGYASPDGRSWSRLEALPSMPDPKKALTSRGLCSIGKVGKSTGVNCAVSGLAWGITDAQAVVYDKNNVAVTSNGGLTWAVRPAPIGGVTGVVGGPGNTLVAFGKNGAVAVTRDGKTWKVVDTTVTKTLLAGLTDGASVVLVGDGGTIVKSNDSGETWQVAANPGTASLKAVAKVGGRYVVPMGKNGIESSDGLVWTELADPAVLAEVALPGKPAKCAGQMPAAGEACAVTRSITTPEGLPNVRTMDFRGDIGLAMGDRGLLAMTVDGGATWRTNHGVSQRGIESFETTSKVVVALGGGAVVVSTDGGATFREAALPKGSGRVLTAHVAGETVYLAGAGGTVLRANGALTSWAAMNTGEKNTTTFVEIFDVGGELFASGTRGELYRAESSGALWVPVATGVKDRIQAMTGDATTVFALTYVDRRGGNNLLRSDDGGRHFYVLREVSDSGVVGRFELTGANLYYDERVSTDAGATWSAAGDNYWGGAVEVGDGSGLRIANRASTYTRDRVYVVGQAKDDFTIVDSLYSRGATFRCDAASGCWMVEGGQVYRPL
jgi:photosystem II stability/assembly factor-like uncharacterized protein